MSEVGLRTVRDGNRVLRFHASVLGAGTSQRGSIPRWAELVVYRLPDGTYLVAKISRSTLAHRPSCLRVNRRMVSWRRAKADAAGEELVPRVPCLECQPDLRHGISPDTMLETSIHQVLAATNAESAVEALRDPRSPAALPLSRLVRDVLAQCAQSDVDFARWADALIAPNPLEKTTRTG